MDMLSTYRVQFHKGFTFRDASAIVPYLHELGITHLYASPYLKAVAGSTHGYDVIDHSEINPEVGSSEDYAFFVKTLGDHGMSHILDTVPNHMGVDTNDNRWWNQMLAEGKDGKFGNYFDIDWDEFLARQQLLNKVLLPVLGESLGQVLEKNQLQVLSENGNRFIGYYDRRFPVDPASPADAALRDLLEMQHYRLSFWRVAPDEINYRRFFDVTSLAGLRMERQEVFDAAHDFTFKLIATGHVAGLRVDHPDGLLDPKQYFERLQNKFRNECPQQAAGGKPLFVSVEKILNGDETLREDWNVSGTSGYDFLCAVNDLFVDGSSESKITAIYNTFVGDQTAYKDLVCQKKAMILESSLNSELTSLTGRLDALAQLSDHSRDFTKRQLRLALRAIVSSFPVYRCYISSHGVSDADAVVVEQAVKDATERNPDISAEVMHFVRDSVLQRYPVASQAKGRQLEFAQRFQQLTSPVNAKGIEDTAFYIYNRLTSLNEVGGDPGRFGRSADALHQYFEHRSKHWPAALSSLSTHDTKRSEDVRSRINALSFMPQEWETHLKTWRNLNADLCGSVHPNDQYLLYQTLIGAWPLGQIDEKSLAALAERIKTYMQKAMREAKERTHWTAVNKQYEAQVDRLISELLDLQKSHEFLADFIPFQQQVSRIGMLNSVSQTIIRLLGPGIPDTYQGSELWDFSLVDPDNRRPVDYGNRAQMLRDVVNQPIEKLFNQMENGSIKLWMTWKLLQLRRAQAKIFINGGYQKLEASESDRVFAFARTSGEGSVIVVVPRFSCVEPVWGKCSVRIPNKFELAKLKNIFTGQRLASDHDGAIPLATLFDQFPFAVLSSN